MTSSETQALQLSVALLPAAPAPGELAEWAARLGAGEPPADVADAMFASEAARAVYPAGAGPEAIVRAFYAHALGREPDAEGLAFWRGKLEAAATPGPVLAEMVWVAANYSGNHPDGLKSAAWFARRVQDAQAA
jgi:hypothetical protein